jgi:hypothetical protein
MAPARRANAGRGLDRTLEVRPMGQPYDAECAASAPQERPRIEDLLALNEQVGPPTICVCNATIVLTGAGVYRRDTHPFGDDRIACTVSADRRHHPADQQSELGFTTGDLS